jgi:hypothetical protein
MCQSRAAADIIGRRVEEVMCGGARREEEKDMAEHLASRVLAAAEANVGRGNQAAAWFASGGAGLPGLGRRRWWRHGRRRWILETAEVVE